MSLQKVYFFITLGTAVGFVAVGGLNLPVKGFDIPTSRSQDSVPAPDGALLYWRQLMNKPAGWRSAKTFRPKSEPTIFLPVQSSDAKDLRAGSLLVASRGLADPNFAETVILLVHYDAEGVVGLILNRRTDLPLSRVLQGLKAAKGRSDRVYLGGPLETAALFALMRSTAKLDGAEHIFGSVYLISKNTLFEQIISTRPDPSVFHVYLGYAGWNPGQLRKEVQLGAWFIFQGDAKMVFDPDPDSLWQQMIQKTELERAGGESPCPRSANGKFGGTSTGKTSSGRALASSPALQRLFRN